MPTDSRAIRVIIELPLVGAEEHVAAGAALARSTAMAIKELGHVVLYVHDIERSRRFYRDVLGFHEITSSALAQQPVAAFSSGRTHHELLLIEVGANATEIPRGRRVGLYHIGFKVGESDDELRDVYRTLVDSNVTIVGASDHTVTHSLYIEDPDGNEVELFIDVQPPLWKEHPEAVMAPVKPLRL